MTVESLAPVYIEHQRTKGIRSLRKIPYWLKVYANWLADRGLDWAEVTPLAAEEFQTWLITLEDTDGPHYATVTVGDIVFEVTSFHAWLAKEGYRPSNPFFGLRRVKYERRLPHDIPSPAEMAARLAKLREFWHKPKLRDRRNGYRTHVIAEVLYATGMRLNELATLTVDDIDWDMNTIRIRHGKGGVERTAYLSDYATRVLGIYVRRMREAVNLVPGENLFGVKDGRSLDAALNGWLKTTCGLTCHGFRHSVGTHLLQKGCDLRYIQMILGHEDLVSTALYTRISKEDLRGQLDKFHPRGRQADEVCDQPRERNTDE